MSAIILPEVWNRERGKKRKKWKKTKKNEKKEVRVIFESATLRHSNRVSHFVNGFLSEGTIQDTFPISIPKLVARDTFSPNPSTCTQYVIFYTVQFQAIFF